MVCTETGAPFSMATTASTVCSPRCRVSVTGTPPGRPGPSPEGMPRPGGAVPGRSGRITVDLGRIGRSRCANPYRYAILDRSIRPRSTQVGGLAGGGGEPLEGAAQRVRLELAQAVRVPRAHRDDLQRLLVLEVLGHGVVDEHRAGAGERGEPAGPVDGGAEDVAEQREDRAEGHADPHVGHLYVRLHPVGQPQRDLRGLAG